MSDMLVWVNDDSLNPQGPALAGHPAAPRVFVFDDELLERHRFSLKRILFIYESLLEIDRIEIRRGRVVDELIAAAAEHGCQRIVTTWSVDPRFDGICRELRQRRLAVEVVPIEPFVTIGLAEAERLDLKRFSRYWQALKQRALSLNRSFDELG